MNSYERSVLDCLERRKFISVFICAQNAIYVILAAPPQLNLCNLQMSSFPVRIGHVHSLSTAHVQNIRAQKFLLKKSQESCNT